MFAAAETLHSPIPTSMLLPAAVLVLVIFVLMRAQRQASCRRDRGPSTYRPPSPGEAGNAASSLRPQPPNDMARWEVEMHDLARQLSAQLDTKMRLLDQLVRDADRASARLEAAVAAVRSPAVAPAASGPASSAPSEAFPDLRPARPASQADALRAAGAGEPLPPAGSAASGGAGPREPGDRRYEEIYLLADYGFSLEDIAQRSGTPIGEVQLILSLRAKR